MADVLYNTLCRTLLTSVVVGGPAQFYINAPFGRFTTKSEKWTVDGIKSWIVMELVSPICLLRAYLTHPLSKATPPLASPASLLTGLFLVHYTNRALISPLRTPARSRSHIVVPLAAVFFNTLNGSLMGTFLSSSVPNNAWDAPWFWPGIALWFAGFVGNIVHDEILLDLRRKTSHGADGKPHYAIPYGGLYKWVSYPNYFCEWLEWLGFAIAAAPIPRATAAPWVFFAAELMTMFPRAWKGHQWYHEKFPDYPKERKAVIPFLL